MDLDGPTTNEKPTLFVHPVLHPLDLLGPGVQASGAIRGGLATLGPATSAAGSPHAPHDWIYEDGLVKERAGVFGQRFFVFDGFLMDQISVGMDFLLGMIPVMSLSTLGRQ